MEVLTRPPHQDAPMDLSTTARRSLMLSHTTWSRHAQVECVVKPMTNMPPTPPTTRYIPIPKKRHCHAPAPRDSPRRECQSPSPARSSPPSSAALKTRYSSSPETSRKRARMESPKPSDLRCDSAAQKPRSTETIDTAISTTTCTGSAGDGGEWRGLGAGLARANGDVVVAGEGVSQSVMRPRQRGHPSSAGSSSLRSPTDLAEGGAEAVPPSHLLTALLHLQTATASQGILPPAALKDTEALLSAVHQSQMLYYSYCSQLIHTLRAKQIEQQHQRQHQHYQHQQQKHQQQQQQQQQKQQQRYQQQQRLQERPHLNSESEGERRTPLEEARSYESEDTEEDLQLAEDDTLSILRARLNTQETQQLGVEQRSPSAEPSSGAVPSSTTGGDDSDLSQMETNGGARKRAPRALTGKHVRPGTGASASTLFTLRQKLQERQKYREVYGVDPPQPTKSNKGRAKKR